MSGTYLLINEKANTNDYLLLQYERLISGNGFRPVILSLKRTFDHFNFIENLFNLVFA